MLVPHDEPGISDIARAVCPKNRRPIHVKEFPAGGMNVNSYWSGGSKSKYTLVRIVDGKAAALDDHHPYFNSYDGAVNTDRILSKLPEGYALVQYGVFMGKNVAPTIFLNKQNFVKCLPPDISLSNDERKALEIVSNYTTSGRRDNWRYYRLPGRYSPENPLILSLRDKGMIKISKNGAIRMTIDGENSITN